MNRSQEHDAAQSLADSRTTYSLARELLGARKELQTQRDQAIHNQRLFETEAEQHQAARREANGLRDMLSRMDAEEADEITDLHQQLNDRGALIDLVAGGLA